ncbi:transposase [Streptomyces mirabilis]|uniref:transposase n=1 Tax=Streptomyces mirabilis TaxID=68239 RepID=UPI0036B0C345
MSDDQWAALEPLLLAAATTGRASRSKRMLIDGIRWRVRTGAPRWDLPPCYGP